MAPLPSRCVGEDAAPVVPVIVRDPAQRVRSGAPAPAGALRPMAVAAPRPRGCSCAVAPQQLLDAADVPEALRLPFIAGAYRYGLSWRQCVASIFRVHNETLNIWTDILTAAYFARWSSAIAFRASPFAPLRLGLARSAAAAAGLPRPSIVGAPRGVGLRQRTAVFALSAYGFALCKALSAAAHTFGCRSVSDDRYWFGLDFMGLCLSVASSAPATLYAARGFPLSPGVYLALMAVMSRVTCNAMSEADQSAAGKFRWFGSLVAASQLPAVHRLVRSLWVTGSGSPHAFAVARNSALFREWLTAFGLLLTGGVFFVTKVPERWLPPRAVDTSFISHVFWHCFANVALYVWHRFLLRALTCAELVAERRGRVRSGVSSGPIAYVSPFALWAYVAAVLLVFGRHTYHQTQRYRRERAAEQPAIDAFHRRMAARARGLTDAQADAAEAEAQAAAAAVPAGAQHTVVPTPNLLAGGVD